jgi:hypothetical protein
MKYKTVLFVAILFLAFQNRAYTETEKLMGWSDLSWGMSSKELISSLRSQVDFKKYQAIDIYQIADMAEADQAISSISPEQFMGCIFSGNIYEKSARAVYFPAFFQIIGIAVNPLNLFPPLSVVILTPKYEYDNLEKDALHSPKRYAFVLHNDKLIGCTWTSKILNNSKILWEATQRKYGDPEKYFALTNYNKNGGGEVNYVFASYPSKGVCLQLSKQTYDREARKSDLSFFERFKIGDYTNYGKFQTFSLSQQSFNFDRSNERSILSYYYWDPAVVSSINSNFTLFKNQLREIRRSFNQQKASSRSEDF